MVKGAQQFVQDDKIQIARKTITALQYAEKWPDEYLSYVTSERRQNQYKDPNVFFRVMSFKPELYSKRFIFRPISDTSGIIRKAAIEAMAIAVRQANLFNVITGQYISSFRFLVDGRLATSTDLDNLNGDSVVEIHNTAPYAAKLEAQSLYYRASIGGVLYFAAQKIKAAYPQLGVRFVYSQSQHIDGAFHNYAVPVLSIGSRANVIDKLSKPGRNIRSRNRGRARQRRLAAKVRG